MSEPRRILSVGDTVVFAGEEHGVVALAGNAVRLVSAGGAVSVVSLPHLFAAEDFALVGAGPAPSLAEEGFLDALPAKAAQAARFWRRHVVEVITGLPPDAQPGATADPRFDPGRFTLAEREKAKAEQLTQAGFATSARTVRRMRQRWRDEGVCGLVDTRLVRQASLTGRVDPRVVAAAIEAIRAQTQTSTGTKSRVMRQIRQRLDDEHGAGVVQLPSTSTLYRLLDVLSAGRHTFGSAVTRRQTANRPQKVFTPTLAARPGEQVQIDVTPLDVMALSDSGIMVRADLVAAVDVATRTICAAVLQPAGARAVDAALLLARMLVPEPMRPGWDRSLRMAASRIPFRRLVAIDARLELAAAKPVIVPESVTVDRGKVFLSETFMRAAEKLGISVQPARPYQGSDKGVIERTFESISTLFCQHVSGYLGRDVTRRGADIAERAVWSIGDLQELLDEWIIAGWQFRPHEGLRHPFTPDRALSPNDAYAAMVAACGYVPVALTGLDYVELLPATWRTIGDGGIQIDYRFYNNRELRRYRRTPSGVTERNDQWEVHYDPYDVTRIWVRDHRGDGGWIAVEWTHAGLVHQPFADFTWRHARRVAAQRGLDDTSEAAVALVLAALLRRAESGPTPEHRAIRRTRILAELPPRLPELPPSHDEPDEVQDAEIVEPDDGDRREGESTVVPFGLFDPLAEDGAR